MCRLGDADETLCYSLKGGRMDANFYGIVDNLGPVQLKRSNGFPLEKETEFDPLVLSN
jgi:hypothetical protein